MPSKELLIVGGPNGSGKSTFVASYLADLPRPYLCADLIATELGHLDVFARQVEAGREFVRRSEAQLARDEDYIIESTLSGRTLKSYLARARSAGFQVSIVFIYLDSPDSCVMRVRQRVRGGGHNVPEEDIRRRFLRSCRNFWHIYREIADYWFVIYNSSGDFRRIASGEPNETSILDAKTFSEFVPDRGTEP